jgi:hypothetical protein
MPDWKKWVVIGVSAGATVAVLGAIIVILFAWFSSRPAPWNKETVSVVWSEAHETFEVQGQDLNTTLLPS